MSRPVVTRWIAVLLGALFMVLSGCAGPSKPVPAELGPNAALLGVKPAWAANIGAINAPTELRVVGNTLFLASSSGRVVALNGETGAQVWQAELAASVVTGVGSDGHYAAVVTDQGELIALEAGQIIWRQRLGAAALTTPLVAGERVFSLSADRTITAFDAATGRKLWQQQRGSDALVLGQAGVLIPVGDTLVVGIGGRLVGMNPQSGSVRWEAPVAVSRGTNEVERLVDLSAGVSRVGNSVCVRAFQSVVGCVDAATGKVAWTKSAVGSTGLGGDDSVLVGSENDGKVLAWRRADGERLWSSDSLRWRGLTAPVLLGQSIVVGDSLGLLHFLARQDAAPLNRLSTDGSPIMASPALVGKTLIAVTQKGGVFAYRPE
ncbi:outer membrane protein assembly factor BamB [Rhodoferax saidenbachensis]|uniref:Outer membrane protein assembly factor BamB n=1 Tax=Rhodoferax saidenbachensis TaxID=1484693 RepID=A0ABU1ZIU7_9BURK|nr:outer membrane protein assembly factor BamB [Rhodoferax saidenbachensis]MDR7305466.1 outer membrane assembly lipoprotein YfgL [Rhodoferax saidenbachensis]